MKLLVGFTQEDIPQFMRDISRGTYVSKYGFFRFMRKYGLLYMQSEFVREHTDGWSYLFYEGEYYGAFQRESDLDQYAFKNFKSAHSVINMYIPVFGGERLETSSINQPRKHIKFRRQNETTDII